MFNSNQETITIGGDEYILTLNRKGIEAIEKYTRLSRKARDIEKDVKKRTEYVDVISENEDPFADIPDDEDSQTNEMIELLKRTLWICLWDNHHLNIEQVRQLLITAIDENKFNEINEKINALIERVNRQPNDYLKNMKALKAQK